MDGKQQKRAGIIIVVLVVILVIAAVFAAFAYEKGTLTGKIVYTSERTGERFTFIENKVSKDLTLYELQVVAERYGVEHLYQIPVRNLPEDVEMVSIETGTVPKIRNAKGIFVTLNPELKAEASIGAIEIAGVIGTADFGVFKIPTQGAFTEKTGIDYPVKTCEDAKEGVVVILLKLEDENSVSIEGDCILVEGDSYENLIKASERLVFRLFNII